MKITLTCYNTPSKWQLRELTATKGHIGKRFARGKIYWTHHREDTHEVSCLHEFANFQVAVLYVIKIQLFKFNMLLLFVMFNSGSVLFN